MLKFKLAFTMIELIFAIVIIGISMLSLPMIAQVSSTNIEKNLVQEAILIASTDMTKVISGKWDENSRQDSENHENIIYTSHAEASANPLKRIGNINIGFDNNTSLRPTSLGTESGESSTDDSTFDDVDDYHNFETNATTESSDDKGYKQNYKKSILVAASSTFGTLANNPNIKKIEVIIKDSSSNDLVKLHTYVTNNGSVQIIPSRGL